MTPIYIVVHEGPNRNAPSADPSTFVKHLMEAYRIKTNAYDRMRQLATDAHDKANRDQAKRISVARLQEDEVQEFEGGMLNGQKYYVEEVEVMEEWDILPEGLGKKGIEGGEEK
jgi:hypothetical protein